MNILDQYSGYLGTISNVLSGGANEKQAEASQQALQSLQSLETPDIDQMKIQLEALVSQGAITPEQAQAALVESNAYGQVSLDPATRAAQMKALSELQNISEDGFSNQQKADLAKIRSDSATQSRGAQEAILQNAAQRGVAGGGLEMLSRMQAQQAQAGQNNLADLNVAAQADQNKLAALQQIGSLGGNIRSQDYSQEEAKAQAQNAINQFNAGQMQRTGELNTSASNQAQAQNLAEKQRIADANVASRNTQQQYNKSLTQQDYENRYRKAGGVAGAQQSLANAYGNQGAGITKLAGAGIQAGAMAASDENLKKEIKEFDAKGFLDSLSAKTWNYKSPERFGSGRVAGVMAQDLEKTPEGSAMVEDTPEGKMVDYGKGFGTILGSLADMNDRLKKMEGARSNG